MENDSLTPQAHADATVVRGGGAHDGVEVHGRFLVVCIGPDGTEKWRDTITDENGDDDLSAS